MRGPWQRMLGVMFLREKKVLAFLVCCGVLLTLGLAVGFHLQRLGTQAEERRHALTDRLMALEETLTSLQDVQIAQAGLLITGKDSYRERFDAVRQSLARHVAGLDAMYVDDPHNLRVIQELRRLYDLKVGELQSAAEVHRSTGGEAARAMFMSRTSDDYGAAIRMLVEHLKERDRQTYERSNRLVDQTRAQLSLSGTVIVLLAAAFGALAYVSLRREIVERQALAIRLEHEASHDALTGLPNRRSFMHELERAIARSTRSGSMLAIMFIDLDGFKRVNDELGHDAGDALLRKVARHFEQSLRKSDFVARLGGDEFAVLADAPECAALTQLAERLVERLSVPLLAEHQAYRVSASVGLAFFPLDGHDGSAVLSEADAAMYRAKREGKGRVVRVLRAPDPASAPL